MDTNSTVYVAQVIDSLYGSDESKERCCCLFADSIIQADSNGGDRWAVTVLPDGVRLLVGHVIIAVLVKQGIWLSLDEDTVDSQWTGWSHVGSWHWDKEYPHYATIGARNGYYYPAQLTVEQHQEASELLQGPHFASIDRAATKWRNGVYPATRRGHTPAVLNYLHDLLDRQLPEPIYTL